MTRTTKDARATNELRALLAWANLAGAGRTIQAIEADTRPGAHALPPVERWVIHKMWESGVMRAERCEVRAHSLLVLDSWDEPLARVGFSYGVLRQVHDRLSTRYTGAPKPTEPQE